MTGADDHAREAETADAVARGVEVEGEAVAATARAVAIDPDLEVAVEAVQRIDEAGASVIRAPVGASQGVQAGDETLIEIPGAGREAADAREAILGVTNGNKNAEIFGIATIPKS